MSVENLRVPENFLGRRIGILFPGQGSQAVGMGKSVFENSSAAKRVFEEADYVLGFRLSELCFEGPENELLQTQNAQPSILTTSIATLRAFEEKLGVVPSIAAAGHSVGEYAALVAAGSLSFPDALRLVRERGIWMHKASRMNKGSMAAVMGLNEFAVDAICQHTDAQIANVNSAEQIIISGSEQSVALASDLLKAGGAKRITLLTVEGAFHSRLMEPAVEGMKKVLREATIRDPIIPVISNINALPMRTSLEIRDELQRQIVERVRWFKSMNKMREMGVEAVIEMGGTVLTGLARRIDKELKAFSISSVSDMQSLALNPSA